MPSTFTKKIDDCVGNTNGQMVHGGDAGDSCKDYSISGTTLSAKCRDNNGNLQPTSINVCDYFEPGQETGATNFLSQPAYSGGCAQ